MRHSIAHIAASCGLLIITLTGPAAAQQASARFPAADAAADGARRVHTATAVTGQAPRMDGRLDDEAWATAPAATGFTVFEPNAGATPSQRTEVRVTYDDGAIYIGARMYDTSPDSIVAQLARRDQRVHSDWIYVALDSYFDRRTAFVFGVNPRGVKVDMMLYDDVSETISWDAVWDAAVSTDSIGWTAELRIPLSQLRFSDTSADRGRQWGLQFRRTIARLGETSEWQPVPRDANGLVSMFGELHGLDIDQPRNLEVAPYTVARLARMAGTPGDPFHRDNDTGLAVGGDVKYGVTSNLTLGATLNPDFGQVEADPSTVNLTAFETFLPEQRPFFVEGANIFNFGIGIGDGDLGNESLFYSRRIGRGPQGGAPGSAEYSDVPTATTIIGAAKLSGRTASGWSVGLLDAVTGAEHARYVAATGEHGETLVEPMTNYAVARATRDFAGGTGAVGAIATATNRHLDGEMSFLRSSAYTGGMNARHRFATDYELRGFVVGSRVAGDTAAINSTQRSPARSFHRPDNDHAEYDALRTSLSGWAASAELLKLSGGNWRFGGILNARSPGFEANDLGYMQSADQVVQAMFIGYNQYEPSERFRRWNVNMNQWYGVNFGGDVLTLGGNINGGFQLPNFWGANAGINHERPSVNVAALRGGPALVAPASWNTWFSMYSDSRRDVRFNLNGGVNTEPETESTGWRLAPSLTVRAANRAEVSIGPSWSVSASGWQYVTSRTANGDRRYVVARLEQNTAALTARVNYTASPTLSLQLYAQPFISAGRYTRFMEVAEARAAAFDERFSGYTAAQISYDAQARTYHVDRDADGAADFSFGDPDFNFRQMRSNAVVRWEYRPGSTLYVVWGHGRTDREREGTFEFARDARELWDTRGDNVLMLKLSYWLGL